MEKKIVRCEECRYWIPSYYENDERTNKDNAYCIETHNWRHKDGFCKWGVKRGEK